MSRYQPLLFARWSLVAAAAAALFMLAPPTARADENDSAVVVVGADEVVNDSTDATTCKFKGGCFTLSKTVANHTTTALVYAYEYNKTTCASISPGTWNDQGTSDPKHGTDSQATVNVTIPSGSPCAGHTVKAEQVSYASKATTVPVTDKFAIYWTTPDFKTGKCPTCEIGETITIKIN